MNPSENLLGGFERESNFLIKALVLFLAERNARGLSVRLASFFE